MFYALRLFFSNGGCNEIPLGLVVHFNVTVSSGTPEALRSHRFRMLSDDLNVPVVKQATGPKIILSFLHPLADEKVKFR